MALRIRVEVFCMARMEAMEMERGFLRWYLPLRLWRDFGGEDIVMVLYEFDCILYIGFMLEYLSIAVTEKSCRHSGDY